MEATTVHAKDVNFEDVVSPHFLNIHTRNYFKLISYLGYES